MHELQRVLERQVRQLAGGRSRPSRKARRSIARRKRAFARASAVTNGCSHASGPTFSQRSLLPGAKPGWRHGERDGPPTGGLGLSRETERQLVPPPRLELQASSIRRWRTKRRVAAGNGHSRGRTGRIGYPGFRGNRRSSRPPFGYALLDPQVARGSVAVVGAALAALARAPRIPSFDAE